MTNQPGRFFSSNPLVSGPPVAVLEFFVRYWKELRLPGRAFAHRRENQRRGRGKGTCEAVRIGGGLNGRGMPGFPVQQADGFHRGFVHA